MKRGFYMNVYKVHISEVLSRDVMKARFSINVSGNLHH